MTKTDAITAQLLRQMAQGSTALEALRTVCGETAVNAMIDRLYLELRDRAARA